MSSWDCFQVLTKVKNDLNINLKEVDSEGSTSNCYRVLHGPVNHVVREIRDKVVLIW